MVIAMKSFWICAVSILAALMAGCAGQRDKLVLDPVGPVQTTSRQPSHEGFLMVYSAYDAGAHFYSREYDGREFSDYSIFDGHDQLLRKIQNSTDSMIEEPATVSLPPGEYKVIARANGYGNVTVPVTIEQNQRTIIHLEGGKPGSELAGADLGKMVRLPDGQIVGVRSKPQ